MNKAKAGRWKQRQGNWCTTLAKRAARRAKTRPYSYVATYLALLIGAAWIPFALSTGPAWAVGLWLLVWFVVFAQMCARLLLPGNKSEEVHDWALEEHEHVEIASLTGKNADELDKMLQYHMKYGNLEEADRISQKLLTLIDKGCLPEEEEPVAAPKAQAATPAGNNLPSWMKGGKQEEGEELQVKENLPDWMK
jgi:hypothetical protein